MATPNPFSRDSDGLLVGRSFPKLPDGRVNWRALIPPQYLYINKDYKDELLVRFGVKSLDDIDPMKVEDHQLLVMLGGWRELLRLRGYKSLKYRIEHASFDHVSAICEIEFIGNYETNMEPVIHSDSAGAGLHCVSGKMQLFLESMAVNRAFSKCIRAFLGVDIYGKDEFDAKANIAFEAEIKAGKNPILAGQVKVTEPERGPQETDPVGLLKKQCRERKVPITFEALKARAVEIKEGWVSEPTTWESFESIPMRDCFTLGSMITKADEAKAAKKK